MIDTFSLILGHLLLTITMFKVMMRDEAEPPVSDQNLAGEADNAGRGPR